MKKMTVIAGVVLSQAVAIGAASAQTPATKDTVSSPANSPATAVFAGGCFWCTEADFEKLQGVIKAESGYIGGKVPNPTYEQVSSGDTGHTEAVRVYYDPSKVTYPQLVEYFWRTIDPTVKDRQFCDVGFQYRSAIFYEDAAQQRVAAASKKTLQESGQLPAVHTAIEKADTFYPAEEYHQDYYKKNPIRYKFYRTTCGRDARLAEVWQAS